MTPYGIAFYRDQPDRLWASGDKSVLAQEVKFPSSSNKATALVCGAGGFIGDHLVRRLKREGFWVRGVDIKRPEFESSKADDFVVADLREQDLCRALFDRRYDEIYQLAADMGGAGYIF